MGPVQDPAFDAFVRHAAESMEARWSAQGISVPTAVSELFCRIALDHVRQHPGAPNTFYDFSATRLLSIIRDLEAELPGGQANAAFAETFAGRIRAVLAAGER